MLPRSWNMYPLQGNIENCSSAFHRDAQTIPGRFRSLLQHGREVPYHNILFQVLLPVSGQSHVRRFHTVVRS